MELLLLFLLQEVGTIDVRIAVKTGEGSSNVRVQAPPHVASMSLIDGRWPFASRRSGRLQWEEGHGIRGIFPEVPAGRRLVTAAWETEAPTHYLDARWVDVKKGETAELSFTLEPARSGIAEITPARGVPGTTIAFVPADPDGGVPDWSRRSEHPAFTEPLRNGKAVFRGMRPGLYVFYSPLDHPDRPAPTVTVRVEVLAGQTAQAALGGTP